MCRQHYTVEQYFDSIFVSAPFLLLFVSIFFSMCSTKRHYSHSKSRRFIFAFFIVFVSFIARKPSNQKELVAVLKKKLFVPWEIFDWKIKIKVTHKVVDDGLLLLGFALGWKATKRIEFLISLFIDGMRSYRELQSIKSLLLISACFSVPFSPFSFFSSFECLQLKHAYQHQIKQWTNNIYLQ